MPESLLPMDYAVVAGFSFAVGVLACTITSAIVQARAARQRPAAIDPEPGLEDFTA